MQFQKLLGQEIDGFSSTGIGIRIPHATQTSNVIESDEEPSDWQKALSEKENRLMNRELKISVREDFINRKYSQYYKEKEELILS